MRRDEAAFLAYRPVETALVEVAGPPGNGANKPRISLLGVIVSAKKNRFPGERARQSIFGTHRRSIYQGRK